MMQSTMKNMKYPCSTLDEKRLMHFTAGPMKSLNSSILRDIFSPLLVAGQELTKRLRHEWSGHRVGIVISM